MSALEAGSTIGIIGGGQLARMLAMAGARLGYRIAVLEPTSDCPAAQVANVMINAAYDDRAGLRALADVSDVITYEFENVPVEAARTLTQSRPVYPPALALEVAQDRVTEKGFINGAGIATARYHAVDNDADLAKGLLAFGGSGVLKTRRLGYDGKGQKLIREAGEDTHLGVYSEMGSVPLVLEELVAFEREISIIAARTVTGEKIAFDPARNEHRQGILHQSVVPAGIDDATAEAARAAAFAILDALDYVGVIGVEFFVVADGSLLVNEIAPRVHNSGHWTEAACVVSQFEQHMRAVAGLPLGDGQRHSDCVMENLIGSDIDKLPALLREQDLSVHLYGKTEVRPGRKMGHFTRLSNRKTV